MTMMLPPPRNEVTEISIPRLAAPSRELVEAQERGAAVVAFFERMSEVFPATSTIDENQETIRPMGA